ncbi:MAG TPA: tripartite tricarboxylate transporter TctB family protein [Candidatus Binatia bacterium]|nr:tripartite tricarboxylate transporter TctB family protein [Candidatus Binatia bacterium]
MKAKPAELIISLGVLALGIVVAVGTTQLSAAGGYARIGPNAAPVVVAGGLILLGIWLLYEAFSGGWHSTTPDQAAAGEQRFYAGAFIWVSAGLFAQMLLIHRAGFVLAQAVLFTCVARGFASRRPIRDFAIGLALALGVFLFFIKFLNVNLPAGWLKPILGTAGI